MTDLPTLLAAVKSPAVASCHTPVAMAAAVSWFVTVVTVAMALSTFLIVVPLRSTVVVGAEMCAQSGAVYPAVPALAVPAIFLVFTSGIPAVAGVATAVPFHSTTFADALTRPNPVDWLFTAVSSISRTQGAMFAAPDRYIVTVWPDAAASTALGTSNRYNPFA